MIRLTDGAPKKTVEMPPERDKLGIRDRLGISGRSGMAAASGIGLYNSVPIISKESFISQ